jgi:DNA-binding transcriptional LysR family regulator
MDINQIGYFLTLAETLNFTEAARRSGISQPSLTKSIHRLEEELGAPLIYRDGKDTRLTALGRDVQVEFMRIQASLDGIGMLAQDSMLGRRARLAIGIASTIGPQAFAGFWAHVIDQMPSVELYFHPMLPGESETEVLSGKYNLCLLTDPPKSSFKLKVQPLFEEPLRLAVSASHPLAAQDEVTQEDMARQTYIDRLHCEFRTQLIEHFMNRNVVMHPRIQSEREDWVQQLVARGVGVCALPERSAIVDGLVLKPVQDLTLSRQVSMVTVSGSGNPREVRQILMLAQAFDWSQR